MTPKILLASIAAVCLPTFAARPRGDDDEIPDPDDSPDWASLEAKTTEAEPTPEATPAKEEPTPPAKEEEAKEETAPEITPKEPTSKDAKIETPEEEDEELKKHDAPPHFSESQKKHWNGLKATTKAYKQERDAARSELATLKASGADPKAAEEIKELREQVERLSKVSMIVDVEESAEFKKTYHEPVETAQNGLKDTLTRLKMPPALIEQALKEGDNWKRWKEAQEYLNDGEREELDDARRAVRQAARARETAVSKLRGPEREAFLQERTTQQQEQDKQFWHNTGKEAMAMITKDGAYMNEEKVPENATEDQKKAIEGRNAVIKEHHKQTSTLVGKALIHRDPQATAQLAFRAANSLFLGEQLNEAKETIAALQKRVDAAEGKLGKARNLPGNLDKGRPTVSPKKGDEEIDFDAEPGAAMDAYRNTR